MKNHDPYSSLPQVPEFELSSRNFTDGEWLPLAQVSGMLGTGGGDSTPHLAWSGAPHETASFAITCFDPDAPTASGFWHLAMYNVPKSCHELAEASITLDQHGPSLPGEIRVLRNDGGVRGYVGAAPPPAHGPHRYMFVVHALDVSTLDLDENASPAFLGFNMFAHTVARARITGLFEHN